METEITCLEQLQQPALESLCLDTSTGGSLVENCSADTNSSVDPEPGETGNAEKNCSLSVITPASEVSLQEHSLGPLEDWVCLSSNTERDYCQTEEEGREQPVVSTQSLSDDVQSEAEQESLTVGILPPLGCDKQAEETDTRDTVIREGQEATKGKEISKQETEDDTAKRREEETNSELTDLLTPSEDRKVSVMGQSSSAEGSEVSDTEGEDVRKEEMKLSQEGCDRLSLNEQRAESEGLTDTVSTPRDLPSPLLIDCGDVIEEPESAVPCLSIEGLHEGEPPPDINSLEQNQETAVWDYATEQQRGLAPETGSHSGNCTETASGKELDGEDDGEPSGYNNQNTSLPSLEKSATSMEDKERTNLPPEMMPISSNRHADVDSGTNHRLSSDDSISFQSVGSSTTDIFLSTQDNANMKDQDYLENTTEEMSSTGFKMEEPNDSKPGETVDSGLPLELTVTDCCQAGTKPESQLSPSFQTMDALNTEGTEEMLTPELSKEDLLLGSALSESGNAATVNVDESETGEAKDSDLNAGIEHLASEVTDTVSFEPCPSVVDESEVIVPDEGDHQSTETGDKSVVDSAEKSGDEQLVLQLPKQDNTDMTADERSPDETSRYSENQTDVLSLQGVTGLPDAISANVNALEVELTSPDNEASVEPHVDNEMTEHPETLDAVDGASESALQGGLTLIYFSLRSGLF